MNSKCYFWTLASIERTQNKKQQPKCRIWRWEKENCSLPFLFALFLIDFHTSSGKFSRFLLRVFINFYDSNWDFAHAAAEVCRCRLWNATGRKWVKNDRWNANVLMSVSFYFSTKKFIIYDKQIFGWDAHASHIVYILFSSSERVVLGCVRNFWIFLRLDRSLLDLPLIVSMDVIKAAI